MIYNASHLIKTKHARKLVDNWRKRPHKPPKEKDTEAVWFPKALLLDALKTKDPGKEISGLRFYMGAYEENNEQFPKEHAYKGMVNLIIVQTYTVDGPGGIQIETDILQDPDAEPAYDSDKAFFEEYNDGQICPPGKGCDATGLRDF